MGRNSDWVLILVAVQWARSFLPQEGGVGRGYMMRCSRSTRHLVCFRGYCATFVFNIGQGAEQISHQLPPLSVLRPPSRACFLRFHFHESAVALLWALSVVTSCDMRLSL